MHMYYDTTGDASDCYSVSRKDCPDSIVTLGILKSDVTRSIC